MGVLSMWLSSVAIAWSQPSVEEFEIDDVREVERPDAAEQRVPDAPAEVEQGEPAEPIAEEPIAEEPIAEEPIAEEPIAEEPKPAAATVPPEVPLERPERERAKSSASALRAFAKRVHPGGFVQVDFLWRQISQDQLSDGGAEPLNETGFHLRSARLGADVDWRYFGVTAYGEFFSNGGAVRPATVDVHAQLPGQGDHAPLLQVRAGLLRVPFGFENYNQNDVQRFFGERVMVMNAYMPGLFDIGASVGGHIWALDWVVGVYNGQPVGAPGFAYRDPNAAKDFVGRLQLGGRLARWFEASIGFSFLTGKGFSAGTPPTKDSFDWVDLNQDGRVTVAELIPVVGSAGRASENFRRWGLGGDIQLRSEIPKLGPLVVYAEVAAGSNLDRAVAIADPVLSGRDQRGLGGYVGLTQALTKHVTVGVRYDEYLPDLDNLEPYGGVTVNARSRFQTVSSGVAGHLYQGPRARARLLLEYEHQRNTLGRDAQGRPDQLANDTFRVRTEVAF